MQKILGLAGLSLLVIAFLLPTKASGYTDGLLFFGGLAVLILGWLGPGSMTQGYATRRVQRDASDSWSR